MTDLETIEAMLTRAKIDYIVARTENLYVFVHGSCDPNNVITLVIKDRCTSSLQTDWRFRLDGSLFEVEVWDMDA